MKKTIKQSKLDEVEVETIIVRRWECPDCGLIHEQDENIPSGRKITCTDEGRYAGCNKQFKAVTY